MAEIQFNGTEWEVSDALQAFYVPYASYVIQSRALPDARDGLKTGARYILYAQYKDKLTCKDKRRKAVATVNATMRFNPHGDAAILGAAVRLSQDFSQRYPIIEVQGNNGSYLSGDDYSQARYIEMRGNKIAYEMTELLDKETIDEWKMNYTNEELYPTVLPSKFPFGLVNGSFGIGVACASSLPPHNINDVCDAAILLVNKPDATFEELYCPIDLPTGGTIINEASVKESLKTGCGKAALIRASIDYDEESNELIVREVPYMTFTNNIMKSINKAIDEGNLLGVESAYDGTDYEGCKIYIKLSKHAQVKRVLSLLYKHTLLQNSFSINMNMLENGKIPRLYGWKEMLETYLVHLRTVIVKAYEFDLRKLKARIHILKGLIIAYNAIDDVVKDIRNSANTAEAREKLTKNYELDNVQADAILKMKLSSLTHLEVDKLTKEKEDKEHEANRIEDILSSEEKIKEEMIFDLNRLKKEYGDKRRTINTTLEFNDDDETEPVERKELLIHFTNLGNIYTQESTTLMTTRRGGKGKAIKIAQNEVVIQTIKDSNFSSLLAFTNKGKMYSINTDELPVNAKINVSQLFEMEASEKITTLTTLAKKNEVKYFTFITKNGIIKKTKAEEYEHRRGRSLKAINLKDDDEVIAVHFLNDEKVGILTSFGNCVILNTEEINPIGRTTAGVRAIKLGDNDKVISSHIVKNNSKYMITVSKNGLVKKSLMEDFPACSRGIKGKKISAIKENDSVVEFLTFDKDSDIIITTNKNTIKFDTSELRVLSRDAIGVKALTLKENDFVVGLIKT